MHTFRGNVSCFLTGSEVRFSLLVVFAEGCYVRNMDKELSVMQLQDFEFRKHPAGFQAVSLFDNGFGCSVIPESDGVHYEVAILEHEDKVRSHLCYTSGLTDDVFRYLTVDDVHRVVMRARNLKEGTKVIPPHPFDTSY